LIEHVQPGWLDHGRKTSKESGGLTEWLSVKPVLNNVENVEKAVVVRDSNI
jgi:hypothetical protein